MPVNKNEITKEMLEKAMQCKTAEELIAYAKTAGVDLTKEEAGLCGDVGAPPVGPSNYQ